MLLSKSFGLKWHEKGNLILSSTEDTYTKELRETVTSLTELSKMKINLDVVNRFTWESTINGDFVTVDLQKTSPFASEKYAIKSFS